MAREILNKIIFEKFDLEKFKRFFSFKNPKFKPVSDDLQYFVNIGENSLNEILEQDILSDEEKSYIEESLILKLFDKDPKSWLMGTEFN